MNNNNVHGNEFKIYGTNINGGYWKYGQLVHPDNPDFFFFLIKTTLLIIDKINAFCKFLTHRWTENVPN